MSLPFILCPYVCVSCMHHVYITCTYVCMYGVCLTRAWQPYDPLVLGDILYRGRLVQVDAITFETQMVFMAYMLQRAFVVCMCALYCVLRVVYCVLCTVCCVAVCAVLQCVMYCVVLCTALCCVLCLLFCSSLRRSRCAGLTCAAGHHCGARCQRCTQEERAVQH